jgi:hypothetical protein
MASSTKKKGVPPKGGAPTIITEKPTNDHAFRSHALCSASSSERWLNCPGSVSLSLQAPPDKPSPAAAEGTRCHELAEKILEEWAKSGRKLDNELIELKRRRYSDTRDEKTGWDMVDYAMTYVNTCVATVEEEFDKGTKVDHRLEHRLTLNADMKMYGIADFLATGIRGGEPFGVVCDLKYGKTRVKADDNSQLAFYAVALKKNSKKALKSVKARVVQPRIGHWLSEVEYTAEELSTWDERLTLGAEKALLQIGSSKPELNTGKWCFFCPARDICPAKANEAVSCFDEVTEDDAGIFG